MSSTDLRALVARMQENVNRATSTEATENDRRELVRAWDALVERLALGPEPQTRPCPHCSRVIMREATLCGYCWTKSEQGASHA